MRATLSIGSALTGLLIPATAVAGYGLIDATVNSIGASLPSLLGGAICPGNASGFIALVLGVVVRFRPLLTIIAGFTISIFGIRMIVGQQDDAITKAKTVMTGLFSGLILVWLVEPFVDTFYGCSGERFQGDMASGIAIANTQVAGLINWAMAFVAALAVMMIILVSMKALFKPYNEDSVQKIRQTIIAVVSGLILLVMRQFIATSFVGNTLSPVPLLRGVIEIVSFFMGFLALAALVVLIYSGITVVLNMGKDEAWQKAKGHLIRAAIGFVVILTSLALVNFVILPAVS